jgi:hypothetical protein
MLERIWVLALKIWNRQPGSVAVVFITVAIVIPIKIHIDILAWRVYTMAYSIAISVNASLYNCGGGPNKEVVVKAGRRCTFQASHARR